MLELLTRRLFRHLDEHCNTKRINFEPGDGEARRIFTANAWMEHRRDRVRMHNYVAQKLHNERGFVVHHVDADQTWEQYTTQTQRPQVTKLDPLLLIPVRKILHEQYRRRSPESSEPVLRAEVDGRIARFFRLIPCWEIEAWLYQNTEPARRLCKHRPTCQCEALLTQWRADRSLLDEVENPSDRLCLGKDHNQALAQGFPTAEVYRASKSLAAALDAMRGCDALLHAIQRTY
ncbi:MAG: hypothetical protein H0T76_26905 [Nannocystis sp.]|nr:hypothetical protein [Nannocystis sp.]MBA3550124.1 hypothetical protein [Nannocystis sp.]